MIKKNKTIDIENDEKNKYYNQIQNHFKNNKVGGCKK